MSLGVYILEDSTDSEPTDELAAQYLKMDHEIDKMDVLVDKIYALSEASGITDVAIYETATGGYTLT